MTLISAAVAAPAASRGLTAPSNIILDISALDFMTGIPAKANFKLTIEMTPTITDGDGSAEATGRQRPGLSGFGLASVQRDSFSERAANPVGSQGGNETADDAVLIRPARSEKGMFREDLQEVRASDISLGGLDILGRFPA